MFSEGFVDVIVFARWSVLGRSVCDSGQRCGNPPIFVDHGQLSAASAWSSKLVFLQLCRETMEETHPPGEAINSGNAFQCQYEPNLSNWHAPKHHAQ